MFVVTKGTAGNIEYANRICISESSIVRGNPISFMSDLHPHSSYRFRSQVFYQPNFILHKISRKLYFNRNANLKQSSILT